MIETLLPLMRHLRWADERTIASVRSLPAQEPRALAWLGHIAGSEHMWLCRIHGVQPRMAVWPELDVEACERLVRENHSGFHALLEEGDDQAMQRIVRYVNTRGDTYDSRVGDILLHVAMHGQYHRGQVAAAVRARGGVPVATDYIVFSRGDPVG